MIRYTSKFSKKELKERWDEYTSPARFAGSDATMDLIFTAQRNGSRVKLVRRARLARDPFSSVFCGRIKKTEQGSEISGYFRKSIFDYFFVGIILALLFYIRSFIVERGDSLNTINTLLICGIVVGALLLRNSRSAKRKYSEFIFKITDNEMAMFLSKKKLAEIENDDQAE